jgi:hypothetical protein
MNAMHRMPITVEDSVPACRASPRMIIVVQDVLKEDEEYGSRTGSAKIVAVDVLPV